MSIRRAIEPDRIERPRVQFLLRCQNRENEILCKAGAYLVHPKLSAMFKIRKTRHTHNLNGREALDRAGMRNKLKAMHYVSWIDRVRKKSDIVRDLEVLLRVLRVLIP